MEDYVYANGKKLRKGYTTGTCATAASLAATHMILQQELLEKVEVKTASGVDLVLHVEDAQFSDKWARAAIRKDGGDDADATHGLLIYSEVTLREDCNLIQIEGGTGVGRVTKPGLALEIGMAAINKTPRQQIEKQVREILGADLGADILISVPKGEETARLTYNSRLGIEGGISILGTTGIVNPMSEDSWKAAITVELTMLFKNGSTSVILVPGNYGEDFAFTILGFPKHKIVNMSNFIGHVLKEAQRIGFERILMIGHIGKFVKVASGTFSTHSKDADARIETLIANVALLGAPLELLREIDSCLTTDAACQLIEQYGFQEVYQVLVDKIQSKSMRLLRNRNPQVTIDVILFGSANTYLASSQPMEKLIEEWL